MRVQTMLPILIASFVIICCTDETRREKYSVDVNTKENVNLILLDSFEVENYPLVDGVMYLNDTVILEVRKGLPKEKPAKIARILEVRRDN